MATPRKPPATPLSNRPMLGAQDLASLGMLIEALERTGRGDLYIDKAVIRISNGNGYPVGHLVRDTNDEEYNFVTWDGAHDEE